MIVPDGLDYQSLSTADAPTSGGLISRLLWLMLLAGGLLIIAWRIPLAWIMVRWLNPFLLIFVMLAVISVFWSIDPSVTFRRLIRVFTIAVDAVAFALVGWHTHRFQNALRPILTAVLLASIIFGLLLPELAIHQETSGVLAGAWHGIASHKNGLGDIACIGFIFWVHAWLSKEVGLLPALIGAGLSASCLYLSRSSTSIVAAAFTLLFLALLLRSPPAFRRYMPYIVALFISTLLLYSVALLHFIPGMDLILSPISGITGKDLTFTGRTEIWDIMLEHIRQCPYLGTGYSAYWTGPSLGAPSNVFVLQMNFYPGSAHNGYLDVLNDLGAVGLFVLFGYLLHYIAQSLDLLNFDRNQASLYLALFLQQAISNLTESHWFTALSVDFAFMTLATAALARSLLAWRMRQTSTQHIQSSYVRGSGLRAHSTSTSLQSRHDAHP